MMRILSSIFLLGVLYVSAAEAQKVTVNVDASRPLRQINPLLYGINTARWDESLFPAPADEMLLQCDRDAIAKIKASGVTMLKYPGGNDADSYIWNSPSNNPTEMNTDECIALCREVGAEPFITINFNAPASLAAEWVKYCKDRGYGVKYWEVGDEQWGTWAKGHAAPEVYAQKYASFVQAMKAADPSIKVATNVPLGPHPEQWTTRVLKAAGKYVDMLTVTYYPQQWGKENDDTLLASTALYGKLFSDLRREAEDVVGKARADSLLFVNVGYNSVNHSPGPQTIQIVNAIWTADMIGMMASTGTDVACYWAIHNAYPPRGGDYGYLSSEGSNTPRYSYFVFPMLSQRFRGSILPVQCSNPSLSVYAAAEGKRITLLLINKDRSSRYTADIRFAGFRPQPVSRRWVLDESRKDQELPPLATVGDHLSCDVPPYSVMVAEVLSADSIVPPSNIAPEAEVTASSYSTIGPHFGPSSATDGKSYTHWNSAAWTKSDGGEKQWLQLQWNTPRRIQRVKILWGPTYAIDYALEVSANGTQWESVKSIRDGKGGTEEHELPAPKAKFLRINGLRGTKGISAYSVREIEVYEQ